VAGRLELYGATGKPLAVFARREAAPAAAAASLEGTAWRLVKFQGGDDRTLTPGDRTRYTIEFAADGRLAARVDRLLAVHAHSWRSAAIGSTREARLAGP
jgi:hypothetical protein